MAYLNISLVGKLLYMTQRYRRQVNLTMKSWNCLGSRLNRAVRPLERQIEPIAIKMLSGLLNDLASKGFDVPSVGVVGSPDRQLDRIGNPHIRAHAAEGILFRRVLEIAAV